MKISRSKSVCINFSNIHLGGGINVASSFLSELVNFKNNNLNFTLLVSSIVYKNLSEEVKNKLGNAGASRRCAELMVKRLQNEQ